ncbi:hypothetical protein ACE106_07230 [Shouchella clausii]|uniref:hypothetical protein n=1 Tax=Shouchella clausii TaxID=79880 RepID=UPI00289A3EC5|nr:hypothetical protein [Shouchella clausii]
MNQLKPALVAIAMAKGVKTDDVCKWWVITDSLLDTVACLDLINNGVQPDNLRRALIAGVPLEQIEVMWYGLTPYQRAASFNKTYQRSVPNV